MWDELVSYCPLKTSFFLVAIIMWCCGYYIDTSSWLYWSVHTNKLLNCKLLDLWATYLVSSERVKFNCQQFTAMGCMYLYMKWLFWNNTADGDNYITGWDGWMAGVCERWKKCQPLININSDVQFVSASHIYLFPCHGQRWTGHTIHQSSSTCDRNMSLSMPFMSGWMQS